MPRMPILHARDDSRGFTLIEVLIAVTILSMGLLGTYSVTVGTIRGLTFNNNRMIALTMTQDSMERIKNADYTTVVSASYPSEAYDTIVGRESFQRTITIDVDATDPTKTITVIVSWHNQAGAERNVTLSTIITF